MAKAPAFQFYVRDWLSDPELRSASLLSRGAWIDCLCFMWENSRRGELIRTPIKFARLISGSLDEALHFLNELYEYEFGDIEIEDGIDFPLTLDDCNVKVTVRNRRMYADYKDKQNTRLRVRKHREKLKVTPKKQKCNAEVTVTSSSSSSSSTSPTKNKTPLVKKEKENGFNLFWEYYPKKVSKGGARKIWDKIYKTLPPIETIISALERLRNSDQWISGGGQYIPYPSKWLNEEGWEDEPQEYRHDLMPKSISEAERLEERMRGERLYGKTDNKLIGESNRPALTVLSKTNE